MSDSCVCAVSDLAQVKARKHIWAHGGRYSMSPFGALTSVSIWRDGPSHLLFWDENLLIWDVGPRCTS